MKRSLSFPNLLDLQIIFENVPNVCQDDQKIHIKRLNSQEINRQMKKSRSFSEDSPPGELPLPIFFQQTPISFPTLQVTQNLWNTSY